jgi:TRAP-type C4-dicarboxylate transport system substrate-binding protein
LATLKSNGMKVLPPSETLAAELNKIGETMASDWAANAGDAGVTILQQFKK